MVQYWLIDGNDQRFCERMLWALNLSVRVIPGINHSGPRMVMGRKRAVIAVKKRPENGAQMQCIGASSC